MLARSSPKTSNINSPDYVINVCLGQCQLAQLLSTVVSAVRDTGRVHITINRWISLSHCVATQDIPPGNLFSAPVMPAQITIRWPPKRRN